MKLGFIGFGEAAFNIASGLKEAGWNDVLAFDKFWDIEPRCDLIRKRAGESGVTLLPSLQDLVEASDMIMSAVSADMAVELAKSARPYLKPDKIYVDLNATSPMTKEEADAVIGASALFVDCAVMGPVPTYKHKVPVLVSGKGAAKFMQAMKPFGMNVTLMDAPAGSASASKMFRSIFMKGFVMLILEMVVAAHKYGVENDVLTSVNETLTKGPLPEIINGLVARGVIHSERREHEMEEVIATLDAIQADGTMSRATKEKLRWCTGLALKEYFQGVPPKDFREIFIPLDQKVNG